MAPLPTIPNVVRCDFGWNSLQGVSPHNTFHIATASTDLEQIAEDIGTACDSAGSAMWGALSDGYVLNEVLLTPLDGSTAGQIHPLGTVIEGVSTGGVLPAVSVVLSMRTLQRGPRGRGRVYLGPISEGLVDNGLISLIDAQATAAAWTAFDSALAGTASAGSLVVASYVHAEAGGVVAISCRRQVGTQRRRQDQLT